MPDADFRRIGLAPDAIREPVLQFSTQCDWGGGTLYCKDDDGAWVPKPWAACREPATKRYRPAPGHDRGWASRCWRHRCAPHLACLDRDIQWMIEEIR